MKKKYFLSFLVSISACVAVSQTKINAQVWNRPIELESTPITFNRNEDFGYNKKATAIDTAGVEYMQDVITGYSINTFEQKITEKEKDDYMVFGTNPLFDRAWAQFYPYWGGGMNIEKVLIKFWNKSGPDDLDIKVNVYSTSNGNPNTIIGTQTISFSDIDTNSANYTVVNLPSPVHVTTHFSVGVDAAEVYNTSSTETPVVGIYSTKKNQPHASTNARIYGDPGTGDYGWHSVKEMWGSYGLNNVNFIILPVVTDNYNTGISSSNNYQNIAFYTYPNPATDRIVVEFEIKQKASTKLEIIDVNGKLIQTIDLGIQASDKYTRSIDVSHIPKGIYFFSLIVGNEPIAAKQIVLK